MLVKFNSSTSGQIMMFAPAASQLLEIVQKECTARGVITTEQLPDAIARLRAAVAGDRPSAPPDNKESQDDKAADDGPPVGLGQRAYPLIELLEWTRKEDGFLLWEAAKDF